MTSTCNEGEGASKPERDAGALTNYRIATCHKLEHRPLSTIDRNAHRSQERDAACANRNEAMVRYGHTQHVSLVFEFALITPNKVSGQHHPPPPPAPLSDCILRISHWMLWLSTHYTSIDRSHLEPYPSIHRTKSLSFSLSLSPRFPCRRGQCAS